MRDIDWLAVHWVCTGSVLKLHADEKRMVVRRLADKMRTSPSMYGPGLSAEDVARRLNTTARSVERFKTELPPADKRVCPVCRQPMWVLRDGTVEPHPDRLFVQCPMSNQPTRRGLAAIRPDLYGWMEGVSA